MSSPAAPGPRRRALDRRAAGVSLPVRALATVFRGKYLAALRRAFAKGALRFAGALAPLAEPAAFARWLDQLRQPHWVVYAKRPFAGPAQVLEYLGRYTHRVALSNDRLLSLDDGIVRFRWKDYADGDRVKVMALDAEEFIRRFLLHVVPDGFVRIRHFGLLANRTRTAKLARCRELLAPPPAAGPAAPLRESVQALMLRLTGLDIARCAVCHQGQLRRTESWPPRPISSSRGHHRHVVTPADRSCPLGSCTESARPVCPRTVPSPRSALGPPAAAALRASFRPADARWPCPEPRPSR